jgi:DNA modification methylase
VLGELRAKSQRRRAALARSQAVERTTASRNDLLPDLTLVDRALGELQPPARNVRPPDPEHVNEIAAAITALGFSVPVLIDTDNRVIDGWARVEAARRVGLKHLPCIQAGHLSPAERRVLRLAVNRLGETGQWDLSELKVELGELILEDAPIEVSGFSEAELDQILLDEEPDTAETGPLEPDAALEPIARTGDLFTLGPHRIACGDARDPALLGRLMAGESARLVLTDVPYNVPIRGHVSGQNHREFAMASGEMSADEFLAFNRAWMREALGYLVEGGVLGTFIDWRGYPAIHAAATAIGADPLNLVVWSKTNAGMGSLYRSGHELLPLYKKGRAAHVNNVELGRHGRWRSNVWTYPGASALGSDARKGLHPHPTVKPTAMLEDALLDLTHRGEVVLDPFLGSGSTLIAAEKAGRTCRGVEIDPLYVDVVLRRYEAATGVGAVRIAGEPPAAAPTRSGGPPPSGGTAESDHPDPDAERSPPAATAAPATAPGRRRPRRRG